MVTVLAWQNCLIDSVTSPGHRACSQHFRYSSQSKQNRTLFQCGCSHNDWFALYARSYSHLDELVILRSDYRLHHAADSQLECDEDEGIDTVNRRQLDTGTSGSLRLLSYVRYIWNRAYVLRKTRTYTIGLWVVTLLLINVCVQTDVMCSGQYV